MLAAMTAGTDENACPPYLSSIFVFKQERRGQRDLTPQPQPHSSAIVGDSFSGLLADPVAFIPAAYGQARQEWQLG